MPKSIITAGEKKSKQKSFFFKKSKPARIIFNEEPYQKIGRINKGAQAKIEIFQNKKTGKYKAVKISTRVDEIEVEAEIAHQLGRSEGYFIATGKKGTEKIYLIEDLYDGEDLLTIFNDLLDQKKPDEKFKLTLKACYGLIVSAIKAVQEFHNKGYVHADIKLENLILTKEGDLWLTDFGLSFLEREAKKKKVGTLPYMAPEMWGVKSCSFPLDIYTLGWTILSILCEIPVDYFLRTAFLEVENINDEEMQDIFLKQKDTILKAVFDYLDETRGWKDEDEKQTVKIMIEMMLQKKPDERVGFNTILGTFEERLETHNIEKIDIKTDLANLVKDKITLQDVHITEQIIRRSLLLLIDAINMLSAEYYSTKDKEIRQIICNVLGTFPLKSLTVKYYERATPKMKLEKIEELIKDLNEHPPLTKDTLYGMIKTIHSMTRGELELINPNVICRQINSIETIVKTQLRIPKPTMAFQKLVAVVQKICDAILRFFNELKTMSSYTSGISSVGVFEIITKEVTAECKEMKNMYRPLLVR